MFVVVRANLEYKAPARFNEMLLVDVEVTSLGRASVVVAQEVRRALSPIAPGVVSSQRRAQLELSAPACVAEIRIACVNADTLYPCPIPPPIYTELAVER